MKINWKKAISSLLVIGSIVAVIWIAFSNSELENAWDELGKLKPNMVLGIFACWFFYMFFDALGFWLYFRSEGFKISIGRTITASLIGFYYSNITPSAAGGQPMQVNSLRKAGIPVGYGTLGATIRFICVQFSISVVSMVFWLCNREFVARQLGDMVWIVRVGWVINFAGVPLVLMAAFQRKLIQKLIIWLIGLGAKIRLVKNREAAEATVTNVLNTYHTALRSLMKKPGQIILQVLCGFAGILALFGSIVFVYHAFRLSGTPWYHLMTISALLYVSASATPLPGASGASEGGFLLFYRNIFPENIIGLALLVWRFFTYYLFLIAGAGMVILEKIIVHREKRRASLSAAEGEPLAQGGLPRDGENNPPAEGEPLAQDGLPQDRDNNLPAEGNLSDQNQKKR